MDVEPQALEVSEQTVAGSKKVSKKAAKGVEAPMTP